jgi:hypothetical protein
MAENTAKKFRLSFVNAAEDVPRLVRAYGKACQGEFALVLRPPDQRGLLVLVRKEGAAYWRTHDSTADAPQVPEMGVSAKDAVRLIQVEQKAVRVPGPITLRGTWSGWLHCDAGTPRVELERKLAQYGVLRIVSGASGWTWTVERTEKWFSKPGSDTGVAASLLKAIEGGLARAMGLLGEACSVRDTRGGPRSTRRSRRAPGRARARRQGPDRAAHACGNSSVLSFDFDRRSRLPRVGRPHLHAVHGRFPGRELRGRWGDPLDPLPHGLVAMSRDRRTTVVPVCGSERLRDHDRHRCLHSFAARGRPASRDDQARMFAMPLRREPRNAPTVDVPRGKPVVQARSLIGHRSEEVRGVDHERPRPIVHPPLVVLGVRRGDPHLPDRQSAPVLLMVHGHLPRARLGAAPSKAGERLNLLDLDPVRVGHDKVEVGVGQTTGHWDVVPTHHRVVQSSARDYRIAAQPVRTPRGLLKDALQGIPVALGPREGGVALPLVRACLGPESGDSTRREADPGGFRQGPEWRLRSRRLADDRERIRQGLVHHVLGRGAELHFKNVAGARGVSRLQVGARPVPQALSPQHEVEVRPERAQVDEQQCLQPLLGQHRSVDTVRWNPCLRRDQAQIVLVAERPPGRVRHRSVDVRSAASQVPRPACR